MPYQFSEMFVSHMKLIYFREISAHLAELYSYLYDQKRPSYLHLPNGIVFFLKIGQPKKKNPSFFRLLMEIFSI